jgi:hypothetical protein
VAVVAAGLRFGSRPWPSGHFTGAAAARPAGPVVPLVACATYPPRPKNTDRQTYRHTDSTATQRFHTGPTGFIGGGGGGGPRGNPPQPKPQNTAEK